jgi:hypothetical protein
MGKLSGVGKTPYVVQSAVIRSILSIDKDGNVITQCEFEDSDGSHLVRRDFCFNEYPDGISIGNTVPIEVEI